MNNRWNNVLLHSNSSIREALEVINNEALRVALIVDYDNKLLGVATDGDIRRGLLNDLALSDPVELVMNTEPFTVEYGLAKAELVDLMEKHDILSLPILDTEGKLVGLETLHDALSKPHFDNPVFIMAGGFGTRLRPLTDDCPKPMLKIGNRPILETLIRNFIKAGFCDFYISTHYMPEQIQAHFGDGTDLGVKITYVHEEHPLGTGGALGLLPKNLPEDLPIIMMNGDVLTKVDFQRLLEFHNESSACATMCVREYEYQIPFGVINGKGNRITSMVEKPIQRYFVNAGIYIISPKLKNSVPANYQIDMPSLLENHMDQDEQVIMFPIHEYWLDIGRMDDFNRAQADILTLGMD